MTTFLAFEFLTCWMCYISLQFLFTLVFFLHLPTKTEILISKKSNLVKMVGLTKTDSQPACRKQF